LISDPETFRRNLAIQRFAVIPLSTNSGLIGWVPHSDTLHGLIKDYREKKKILLNIEHRIMQRMTPDYDHLPLMNKVEVFEHALEHTQGDDLAKILLLKAPSSEVWFDRRTNFTRYSYNKTKQSSARSNLKKLCKTNQNKPIFI
jgi:FKBP12-rapamycin complex-associated protein